MRDWQKQMRMPAVVSGHHSIEPYAIGIARPGRSVWSATNAMLHVVVLRKP